MKYKDANPTFGKGVFIAPGARVMGEVHLGRDSSVFFNSVVRGDVNSITVGEETNIQDNCTLHVTEHHRLQVGSGVTAGHNAILHGCTVEDDVMIGMGAIVLDGAHIGSRSIVAAGSVVPPGKTYPGGSMIMGSPAKVVRELTEQDLDNIRGAARRYVSAKNHYLAESGQQE
jgi:carbonic anhydrase/acetyltransferase-like protein (isoleucine patch superfamily)